MAIDTPEHPGKPDRGFQDFMRRLGSTTPRAPGQTSGPSTQLVAVLLLAGLVAYLVLGAFWPHEVEEIVPVAPKQKLEATATIQAQPEVPKAPTSVKPLPTQAQVGAPELAATAISSCEIATPDTTSFKVTRHPCMFDSPKGIVVSMQGNAGFVYEAPTCKRDDVRIGDPSVRVESGETRIFLPRNGAHCWFVAMVAQTPQGWIDYPDKHVLVVALK